VRAVGTGPVTGLLCQFAVTVALAATVGLGALGWVVGISYGVIANLLLARGLARHGADRLGPADRVTLVRATLAGGVTALVADSFSGPTPVTALVALIIIALVLDAVDGWVARCTMTMSALGARFDGEVDAFLILALSVYVTPSTGGWVLAIGIARYALLAAGWVLPWMGATLPPRYWRKVVAAIQGIALTFAVADVLPRFLTNAVLAVSLALLAESFGRDVAWLWRRRHVESGRVMVSAASPERTRDRGHHVAPLPSRVAASHPRGTPTSAERRHRPAWRRQTLGWPAEHGHGRAATEVGDG
jgi:phosphatidylglycerophosphate synthase